MFKQLANFIDKHPVLIVLIIIIITIGFGSLIPSLQFKTEFSDFMPDDEVVEANMRIGEYFGSGKITLFVLAEKNQAQSTITPEALRELYKLQTDLLDIPEVEETNSIITVIDQICLLEFGKSFENCTNQQIQTALDDLFMEDIPEKITIFEDDEDETTDYNRYPRITKGKSNNEIDLKNCEIEYTEDSFLFTFEVYDLKSFENEIKSPLKFTNVVEWYLDFENLIKPDERLDIQYRLSAHIEPKHALWTIGDGLINNIKNIFNLIRSRELFNTYKEEVYLWIKAPDQDISFPLKLETGGIRFDTDTNKIIVNVSKEELGNFGITPRFGFYELPAKITNYKAGTRYYETSLFKSQWLRVSADLDYLIEKLNKINKRPILGTIAENLLEKNTGLSWEEFNELFNNPDQFIPIPDQIALKDLEENWVNADIVPNTGSSNEILLVVPALFDTIKVTVEGLLSADLKEDGNPQATLMLITVNSTADFDGNIELAKKIINKVEEIDGEEDFLSTKITGDVIVSVQINEVTDEANQIIIPMIFIVIFAILFISFRRPSYVILPMLALVISAIWLFGSMVLLGINFNTIAVAIVPLIMGLGVDYSVHILHHYRSELGRGKTPSEAIKNSVLEIGNAMFLAMITTVIAFTSFLTATLPPIRDFGLLLALGIIYTFITAITLLTSSRLLLDRKKEKFNNGKKRTYKLDYYMGKLGNLILSRQKTIIVILLIITIIFGFQAVQIKTGFNFDSFLPEDNEALGILEEIQNKFPFASEDQEYILLEGDVATVQTLEGMRETHEKLKDDTFVAKNSDGSLKTNSIYKILMDAAKVNETLIEKFNLDEDTYIPKTDEDVKRAYDYLLESFEYGFTAQSNINKDNGKYNAAIIRIYVTIQSENVESAALDEDLGKMMEEFKGDISDYGNVDATITGNYVIWQKISSSLTESQVTSTGISLVLACIVLIISYRRPSLGIIAMIPVMVSIVWILGTMTLLDWPLDILTITVTSLTIGIGIDYAIHATERFRLVIDKTGDIKAAVVETISRTGGALLIAALTTSLGFSMLIFAPIPPQVKFGVITAMTIAYSFLTSVLLLPLVLAQWARWTRKRKGYVVTPITSQKKNNHLKDISKPKKTKSKK